VMFCKGLAVKGWLAAKLHPVIIVPKGNPKGIKGTRDLARPGLKVVLTDKIYSTMGYISSSILKKAGVEDAVEKNVVNRPRSGGDAANAVILGHADAAMAWSAVAVLRGKDVDFIEIEKEYRLDPKVDTITGATFSVMKNADKPPKSPAKWPDIDLSRIRVTIDLLKSSEQAEESAKFAEFAVSDDMKKIWSESGFDIPEEITRMMTDSQGTEKKN